MRLLAARPFTRPQVPRSGNKRSPEGPEQGDHRGASLPDRKTIQSQSVMKTEQQGAEVGDQRHALGVVDLIHAVVRGQQLHHDAAEKTEADQAHLPEPQDIEIVPEWSGQIEQRSQHRHQRPAHEENQRSLQALDQHGRFDQTAVGAIPRPILVIHEEADARAGGSQIEQHQIGGDPAHHHPDAVFADVQMMERHGHGDERVNSGQGQQEVAGTKPLHKISRTRHENC